MNGRVRRFRLGQDGHVYKWVHRGFYKRVKAEDAFETPVPLITTEVMIPIPDTDGYRRTHKAVLYVPCSCGAEIGEACRGALGGGTGITHCDRRDAYMEYKRAKKR